MAPRKRAGLHRPKSHDRARATARAAEDIAGLQVQVEALRLQLDAVYEPVGYEGLFDMQRGAEERNELIDYLWAGKYDDCATEVIDTNLHIKEFLRSKTMTDYEPRDRDAAQRRKDKRLNFLGTLLVRNRNVHVLPRQQAILAAMAKQKHINNDFWEVLTSLRVLPSINWTNDLVQVR